MAPADKLEQAAVECSPHLIELREFFASREIAFGSAAALAPFLDRLRNDRRFHDEMASMVRAIIYRTRDGVAPSELSDLVFRAVAGDEVYRLSKPRDEISSFIEDVFR